MESRGEGWKRKDEKIGMEREGEGLEKKAWKEEVNGEKGNDE